jgi:hypothetical protein
MSLDVKVTLHIKLINPYHPGAWTDVVRLYLWNDDSAMEAMQGG